MHHCHTLCLFKISPVGGTMVQLIYILNPVLLGFESFYQHTVLVSGKL